MLQVYLLSWFIASFDASAPKHFDPEDTLAFGLLYVASDIASTAATQGSLHLGAVLGVKMGAALSYMVYKKVGF